MMIKSQEFICVDRSRCTYQNIVLFLGPCCHNLHWHWNWHFCSKCNSEMEITGKPVDSVNTSVANNYELVMSMGCRCASCDKKTHQKCCMDWNFWSSLLTCISQSNSLGILWYDVDMLVPYKTSTYQHSNACIAPQQIVNIFCCRHVKLQNTKARNSPADAMLSFVETLWILFWSVAVYSNCRNTGVVVLPQQKNPGWKHLKTWSKTSSVLETFRSWLSTWAWKDLVLQCSGRYHVRLPVDFWT